MQSIRLPTCELSYHYHHSTSPGSILNGDTIAIQYGGSPLLAHTMATYRKINEWKNHSRGTLSKVSSATTTTRSGLAAARSIQLFRQLQVQPGQTLLWDLALGPPSAQLDPRLFAARAAQLHQLVHPRELSAAARHAPLHAQVLPPSLRHALLLVVLVGVPSPPPPVDKSGFEDTVSRRSRRWSRTWRGRWRAAPALPVRGRRRRPGAEPEFVRAAALARRHGRERGGRGRGGGGPSDAGGGAGRGERAHIPIVLPLPIIGFTAHIPTGQRHNARSSPSTRTPSTPHTSIAPLPTPAAGRRELRWRRG